MAVRYHKEKKRSTDDIVQVVKNWQQDCEGWVSEWESKQVKWHRLRMRMKKEKTYPFVGCSNIRMPTAEIKMRKLKAALLNVIFGIRPIVQCVPSPSTTWETASKVEKFLDHLIMDKMDIYNKAVIAVDRELEKGFVLLKPFWNLEIVQRIETISLDDLSVQEALAFFDGQVTDEQIIEGLKQKIQVDMHELVADANQSAILKAAKEMLGGKEKVTILLQDIIKNQPDVSICNPERVYVPTTSGYDPQGCAYIIHEFFLPLNTLKQNAKHKNWDMDAVDEIKGKKGVSLKDKDIDLTQDQREGIERLQSSEELVKIWECYCWYDINGDDVAEKAVVTIAPDFDKLLRKVSLPFWNGKFPFIKLFYELTDDRWFSHRGIPELIEDIIKEIDIQHMQKLDRQTICNSPTFLYRSGMVGNKSKQFVFGQGIPVSGMQQLSDIVTPLNSHNPNVEFSYEREQMILETKVEELIGQVDFTLQSMINKRQPRTLGEVQMQQQNMQNVFSLDANMHRENFEELFNWVYDLWSQYGDDNYEFAYFGKNGYETIKLSKEELQNKPRITVRGTDQNTNPQNRVQKAQAIMMGIQNPVALQTGVITPIHIAQAYKRYYQELDIPNWEELVSTPQQIARQVEMQRRNQQPPPDDIKFQAKDLTDAEKAQALAKRGIKADIEGRRLNEQNRRDEFALEKLTQIAPHFESETETDIGGGQIGGE